MAHRFFRYITRVFLGETPWPLVSAGGIVITAEAGLIGAPVWLTILGAGVAAGGLLGTINHPGEPKDEQHDGSRPTAMAPDGSDQNLVRLLDERVELAQLLTDWYRRWCDARAAMNGSTTSEAIRYSHGLRSLDDIAIEAVCNERGAIPPQRQSAP